MSDSKDFQDAESIHSGNSHVTSRPVSFPSHPIPEGILSRSKESRAAEKGRQAFWTHMENWETFLQIQTRHHQHLIHKNCISGIHRSRSRSIHPLCRKVKTKTRPRSEIPVRDRQPKIQFSSVEETLPRIMGQTNNDCRFRIFTLTSSLRQRHLLAGR